jgi:hypothetical protein
MRPLNLETHPVVATVSNAVGVPEQLGQRPERSRPKAAIFAKHGAARLPNAFSGVTMIGRSSRPAAPGQSSAVHERYPARFGQDGLKKATCCRVSLGVATSAPTPSGLKEPQQDADNIYGVGYGDRYSRLRQIGNTHQATCAK